MTEWPLRERRWAFKVVTFCGVKNLIQSDGHPTGSSFKAKKDKMNNEWIKAPQEGAGESKIILNQQSLKI